MNELDQAFTKLIVDVVVETALISITASIILNFLPTFLEEDIFEYISKIEVKSIVEDFSNYFKIIFAVYIAAIAIAGLLLYIKKFY
jgi:hypothetical protein